jgi:hypothetical protein
MVHRTTRPSAEGFELADFYFTASPVHIDTTGNAWIDPVATLPNPYGGAALPIPSRQNARSGLPHRYNRFVLGETIEVRLNPLGTTGVILDAGLGGRLFAAALAEVPNGMYTWSSIVGQSSYQFFMPDVRGAYCAIFSRPLGGGIVWHFMVE